MEFFRRTPSLCITVMNLYKGAAFQNEPYRLTLKALAFG
jgi:hypothetical protein